MRASGYARAVNDWYVEDEKCVEGLLAVETFKGMVLDPACGSGNIPKTLNKHGVFAIGSDIVDRGYGSRLDFMSMAADGKVENIVTNPPFGIIEAWIEKCLEHATDKVCILARLAILEGQARREMFKRWPLARVHVSSRRVSMPPGGMGIKAKGGTIPFCWLTFQHGHEGPPVLGWI